MEPYRSSDCPEPRRCSANSLPAQNRTERFDPEASKGAHSSTNLDIVHQSANVGRKS